MCAVSTRTYAKRASFLLFKFDRFFFICLNSIQMNVTHLFDLHRRFSYLPTLVHLIFMWKFLLKAEATKKIADWAIDWRFIQFWFVKSALRDGFCLIEKVKHSGGAKSFNRYQLNKWIKYTEHAWNVCQMVFINTNVVWCIEFNVLDIAHVDHIIQNICVMACVAQMAHIKWTNSKFVIRNNMDVESMHRMYIVYVYPYEVPFTHIRNGAALSIFCRRRKRNENALKSIGLRWCSSRLNIQFSFWNW